MGRSNSGLRYNVSANLREQFRKEYESFFGEGISEETAKNLLEIATRAFEGCLLKGESFSIRKFGTFDLKFKHPYKHTTRLPTAGAPEWGKTAVIQVPGRVSVRFQTSRRLRDRLTDALYEAVVPGAGTDVST